MDSKKSEFGIQSLFMEPIRFWYLTSQLQGWAEIVPPNLMSSCAMRVGLSLVLSLVAALATDECRDATDCAFSALQRRAKRGTGVVCHGAW